MESIFSVIAAIVACHLDISIALVEICRGAAAASVADQFLGRGSPGSDQQWLTFLAGAELEPVVIRTKLKEIEI